MGRMEVPLTDVSWQHRQVWDEIHTAIDGLLTAVPCDGAYLAHRLEQAFERYYGDGWIALSAQSGLAAEFLLLKAFGIGPGDEVITVANSDLATTAAISHAGARFVLAEVRRETANLDPGQVERLITPRTRAIMPVHMYGHPAEMEAITAIARRHKLLVLEDATLALGATSGGRKAGTMGDGAFFSFAPRKVMGGAGNGGMALVRDPEAAERFRLYRGYGLNPAIQDLPIPERHKQPGQIHEAEGYNLKLNGLEAAIVAAKFARLDQWVQLRREAAARYTELLAGCPGVQTPAVRAGDQPAWRNYTILSEDRDGLRRHLLAQGITVAMLYTPPVHLQPVYRGLGLGPGSFPTSEYLGSRLLCLPIYPGITAEQIDHVAEEVRRYHEGRTA